LSWAFTPRRIGAAAQRRWRACISDIERADIIVANMLFLEDHVNAVLPALKARAETCDAIVGSMSAPEIVRLTRLGGLEMAGPQSGLMATLKKLRGGSAKTRPRRAANRKWRCCAACRKSCASFRARPRICALTS
jgi:magnesium chelatase subunit H